MAQDRFVYWGKDAPEPSYEEIHQVLRNYIGDAGTVELMNYVLLVIIPGKLSHPFQHEKGPEQEALATESASTPRYFEVVLNKGRINVTTSGQDELINTIAQGFADLAIKWRGGHTPKNTLEQARR